MPPSDVHPEVRYAPQSRRLGVFHKLFAMLEVALVTVASIVAAYAANRFISPGLGEALGLIDGTPPDFLASSAAIAQQFAAQYGAALILILVIAWLRGRTTRRAYALTAAPLGLGRLVLVGVVAGFIISIPTQSIFIAKKFWVLGKDTPIWSVMESNPWDWRFWLFSATGSFVIPPIVEELMWRSYVLGRFVESFKPGAALILSALTFSLLHVQYLVNSDFLGYATMASVIFIALTVGLLTLVTGSVLPGIVAHVIVNIPMTTDVGAVRLALGVLCALLFARSIGRYFSLLARIVVKTDTLVAILLAAACGVAVFGLMRFQTNPAYIAIGGAAIAVAGAFISKSAWRPQAAKL